MKTAFVFDDLGHYEAIAATEYLISKGLAVTFVTRFEVVAPQLDFVTRVDPAFRRFAASGRFQLLIRSRIEEIGQDRCVIRTLYLAEPQVVPADTVIFINAKEPVRGVYDDLRSHGYQLGGRSEEHTSELQSLMRISYALFCLKKKRKTT